MATTNSSAGPIATETFGTTSPVTGAAPTADTDGLPTADLAAISVYVSSASGTTLSGAGSLLAYEYQPALVPGASSRWCRAPALDMSTATSGTRDLLAGVAVDYPYRPNGGFSPTRVKWVPSGVTFSAGSAGVTVTLVGTKANLVGRGTVY